jgi:hypothetical protein
MTYIFTSSRQTDADRAHNFHTSGLAETGLVVAGGSPPSHVLNMKRDWTP